MEITLTYRPFTGTISAWDTLNDTLPENALGDIVTSFQDGSDEEWNITCATIAGKFHSFSVLDYEIAGAGWNLFLTEYLNDDTIATIANQIAQWRTLCPPDADIMTRIRARYSTTISV